MKKMTILILLLFCSTQAFAEKILVCTVLHYSEVKKKVETEGSFDKYKHCAVSCLLTLRCSATEVMQLGVIKELADIVGPGNAEWDDLKADADGIRLVTTKKAKTDKQCIDQCKKIHSTTNQCSY